jgi:hypothetical protein
MIAVYSLFHFEHERSPILDIRTADIRNSCLCQESLYGLERANDFRYNSRHVSGLVLLLLLERIGFWWMPIGCLSH